MPMNARKRLLVLNGHEAWVYQLTSLPYDLDIAIGQCERYLPSRDTQIWPIPSNGRLIDLERHV